MSFCRWTEDSNLYIYQSPSDIVCCCCLRSLMPGVENFTGDHGECLDVRFTKISEMIAHVEWHISLGDKVPEKVIPALNKVIEDEGDQIYAPGQKPAQGRLYKENKGKKK